ncbi:Cytochrome p450 [Neofusicoccum parvum]|uniref:Cytochrome p450 n=1 Tax=Neofusicoccum parvum TaxID=310453 RepID=A0ACB5RTH0_9PEZI|nr:Cytochrome p450 [Neofusicoccum parvum]
MNLLREEQKGGGGVGIKITHAMNPALLGPGLDRMNEKMISFLKTSVDQLSTAQDSDYDLFSWCRHAITVAATDSAYGKMNPYRSSEIEDAFWTMETNLDKFLVNIAPNITARKVWKARETLVSAFIDYYNASGLSDASAMANARWREQRSVGATLADTARLEAGMALGLLSNTVPAAFWTVFEICSRPPLLAAIRAELCARALHVDAATGARTVDLADIRDGCELLVSTFQETLRVRSKAMPMRMAYQDVLLNDRYLLKEGGIVQMPSPVFHRNESIWGDEADAFEPRRFMKGGNVKETRRMAGFLAFGISPSLCPGRHFATGEVLSLVAMLLLRYDIIPQRGNWEVPKVDAKSAAASFYTPAEEFRVNFKARSEYEGASWAYRVTAGKGRFGLIIG